MIKYMWPQITYLVITFLSLLIAANKHGKPKEGVHEFQYTFLAFVIIYCLLYSGGFFDVILNKTH